MTLQEGVFLFAGFDDVVHALGSADDADEVHDLSDSRDVFQIQQLADLFGIERSTGIFQSDGSRYTGRSHGVLTLRCLLAVVDHKSDAVNS